MASAELHHFWQCSLTDRAASGLCGATFCREYHLGYHQFSYWRRKLRAEDESQTGAGFARVAPAPVTEAVDGLTVSLPGGVSIAGVHAGNVELLELYLYRAPVDFRKQGSWSGTDR